MGEGRSDRGGEVMAEGRSEGCDDFFGCKIFSFAYFTTLRALQLHMQG